jgi:hypothetical protein
VAREKSRGERSRERSRERERTYDGNLERGVAFHSQSEFLSSRESISDIEILWIAVAAT